MRRMILPVAVLSVALACSAGTPSAPRPSAEVTGTPALQGPYEIVDLGPPGQESWAIAINNNDQVVGAARTAGGATGGFLWTDGAMQELGTLGGTYTIPEAINEAGAVAGRGTIADGTWHAFLWTDGAMQDLGASLPAWGAFGCVQEPPCSVEVAINARGEVVWTAGHAFLWSDGVAHDLGTLGGCCSRAHAIDNAGRVAGASDGHFFLWDKGTMQDLGCISAAPTSCWDVAGLNARGQVIGSASVPMPGCSFCRTTRAVVWDGSQMLDLGVLPQDASYGTAFSLGEAINNRGDVLAISGLGDWQGLYSPLLWRRGTITPLPAFAGRRMQAAVALNASGDVAGYWIIDRHGNGTMHTVVWDNGSQWDLGALGGGVAKPIGMNDQGDVVGWSHTESHVAHAVLWRRTNTGQQLDDPRR